MIYFIYLVNNHIEIYLIFYIPLVSNISFHHPLEIRKLISIIYRFILRFIWLYFVTQSYCLRKLFGENTVKITKAMP